eukprot:scaffold3099_cov100-Isochrysis_galbana.AAC.17
MDNQSFLLACALATACLFYTGHAGPFPCVRARAHLVTLDHDSRLVGTPDAVGSRVSWPKPDQVVHRAADQRRAIPDRAAGAGAVRRVVKPQRDLEGQALGDCGLVQVTRARRHGHRLVHRLKSARGEHGRSAGNSESPLDPRIGGGDAAELGVARFLRQVAQQRGQNAHSRAHAFSIAGRQKRRSFSGHCPPASTYI